MAIKINDDTIKGQWKKQNDAHDVQWNAIVNMAQEMGLTLDAKGNVVKRKEKEQTVAPSPSVPSIDMNQIDRTVRSAVKASLPAASTTQTQTISPSSILIQNNTNVLEKVAEKWDPIIQKYADDIITAYGIGKDAEEPPIIEERILQKIVKVHKFIGKILRWIVEDMLSKVKKFLAYNIAFCCALFGGYQYYLNQKLLSEVKRTEVVRYILSGDPANKAMIEKIDTLLESKGGDDIYKKFGNTIGIHR